MQVNGNLKFQVLGSGELQNAIIERLASDPSGSAGRLYYNTTLNAYKYYDGTSWIQFAAGTTSVASFSAGTTGLTPSTATTGAITLAGTLVAVNGGTGQNTYTTGDILYASSSTALSKLATGASGTVLHGGTTPSYSAVSLIADVSGTLPVNHGGTGVATITTNGVVIGAGTSPVTTVTGSEFNVLTVDNTGAPVFGQVALNQSAAVTGVLVGANGGTGVANTGKTITLGGNLTTSGAFATTLTVTGATNVTLPTSGTLVTTTTAVTSVSGTANQITATGANAVTLSIPNTFIAPGTVEVTDTLAIDTNIAHAFVYSDTSKIVASTGAATNGQLLIGSTGANPVAAALTAGTGISITNGAGSITVANTGVTSVAIASDSSPALTVASGSPVTTTGTIHLAVGSQLVGLQAITGTGIVIKNGASSYSTGAVTGTAGNISVTNGDGVAANPTVNLVTVTDSGTGTFLKLNTDSFGRVTGTTAVTTSDITTLVDSTYVNTSGDTMTGNLNMGGTNIVTGLAAPTGGTDATNKNYVDAFVTGLSWKQAVRAATTVTGTLATDFADGEVIDGITLATGDRILIKNQSTTSQNGIYIVQATGAPVRSIDMDTAVEFSGATVFVQVGTVNADSGWTQIDEVTTVGTDPVAFVQFTGAGTYTAGTGLSLAGNTFNVNLGAGIVELPSDEVGIDLYDAANGALILTTTGSNRVTSTGAKLYLMLDGAGALAQTSSGLKVNASSVTNAMLVNSTVPIDVDGAGTTTMTLGTTFNYFGTTNRLTTSATANTVTFDIDSAYVGQSSITTLGTVTTGTWNATTVAANHGGTGFSSYAVGDLLYADSTSTLAKLADIAVGNVLLSGGVATAPSWGKVSLTAAVSGILPAANGGTGVANSNTITLGGNINTAGALTTTGANALTIATTGTTSVTMPTSGTLISTATIASNAVTTFQTSLDGLTPSTGTNGAVTLAGTLGVASGGTGATTLTNHGVVIGQGTSPVAVTSAGTAFQSLVSNGASADPTFQAVALNQSAAVSGTLPVSHGGTGITAVGAAGNVVASTGSAFASTPIQFNYSSNLDAGPATSFTVTHNLGQQFVNVTVYSDDGLGGYEQIIPQSVTLTSSSVVTVTVNSMIDVVVVVTGVAGVALA